MQFRPKLRYMNETRFDNLQEFLKRINLSHSMADSGILILNLDEVSDTVLREFSMYRNEFYEVNLFNQVKNFRYAIDGTIYDIDGEPTFFFVAPNQLQSYEIYGERDSASGYLIYIQKSCFRQVEKTSRAHFFKREYQSCYRVSEEEYQKILYWADLMHRESKSVNEFTGQILQSLLVILILKIKEVVHEELSLLYGRPQEIIGNFIDLIDKSPRLPKVSACASALALTPKQLNALSKKVLGKTANEVIKTQFSDKAKALLIQSELSVKEIAQSLGFEEVSNFSRFFKGINKVSPIVFREQKGANC